MKVLVLLGSNSPEREVSLKSGAAVAAALARKGHAVSTYDPAGGWLPIGELARRSDVVFPALHGRFGEDGFIQTLLEETGTPYVGSDSKVSRLCFDKHRTKAILQQHDIAVPRGQLVSYDEALASPLLTRPYIIKPVDGGSSIDVIFGSDVSSTDTSALRQVFDRYGVMLLEELIEGDEITVPVLDGTALPIIHIIPPEGQDFDYDNKYSGATQEVCPATNIPKGIQSEAQRVAQNIYTILGVRDLCRIDMIVSREGELVVLEVNTLPGMTNASLFPKAAETLGMEMGQLCDKLVHMARKRTESRPV